MSVCSVRIEYVSVCCVRVHWCGCVGCASAVAAGRLACGIPLFQPLLDLLHVTGDVYCLAHNLVYVKVDWKFKVFWPERKGRAIGVPSLSSADLQ